VLQGERVGQKSVGQEMAYLWID